MRIPRVSEPVLRRGFRSYRDVAWKQSPAVSISQEVLEDLPADEGDIALEEDMELSPEFMETEFDLLGEAQEEGTVELTQ